MLDMLPPEYYPIPEHIPVLVQLIDDRIAFAKNIPDQYDDLWMIQLPFEEPQGAHRGMIKAWASIPSNWYHDQILKKHKYGE